MRNRCRGCGLEQHKDTCISQLNEVRRELEQERNQLREEVERLKHDAEFAVKLAATDTDLIQRLREENAKLRAVAMAARKMV